MTVRQLYTFLNEKIPPSLSCSWDNDGLMCCPDEDREVRRVLIALDITGRVARRAVEDGYDVVLSHHPLIFHPLKALDPRDLTAKKVIDLIAGGVAAMSFHTRLDAVEGGVNDTLAALLHLENVTPFGNDGEAIGRIGSLSDEMTLSDFAETVKRVLGADTVQFSDAGLPVFRVAVLGGGGAGEVGAAKTAGADTYLTGELHHHNLTDAPDYGINLLSAGHFHTEDPVCRVLAELVKSADATITVDMMDSNPVRVL